MAAVAMAAVATLMAAAGGSRARPPSFRKPETGPRSRSFPKRGWRRGGPEMTSLHNSASGVILGGEKGGANCEGEVEILTGFLNR